MEFSYWLRISALAAAALKASLAAGTSTPAEEPEGGAKPAARKRSTKKDQLSIDEAKLRRVDGEKESEEETSKSSEAEEAPRTRRKRAS